MHAKPTQETKDMSPPQPQRLNNQERPVSSAKCTWCGKQGHAEPQCRIKRAGRPKAMMSNIEKEEDIYDDYDDYERGEANFNAEAQEVPPAAMTIRVNNSNKNNSILSEATNSNGLIRETFFADWS